MNARISCAALAASLLLQPWVATSLRAEPAELHMATQFGIGTLPMVLVEQKSS